MKSLFTQIQSSICILTASMGLLLAAPVQANVEITTPGPITRIGLTPDGNFYANHALFSAGLFFNDTAAIWAVYDADNHIRFAPTYIPAGGSAQGTPWTPVSQQAVTGTGTVLDPYRISSTMKSTNGLEVTLTVSYITGQDIWSNSYTVRDTSGAARNVRVFTAADLFYDNCDAGYAIYDPATGGVGGISVGGLYYCTATQGNFRGMFIPITPASAYVAADYYTVWNQISANQMTNLVASGLIDNAAGLQWNTVVPANGEKTIESSTVFGNALILIPGALPNGVVSTPYSQTLNVIGGLSPYTLSIASGSLPPGTVFNPTTRTIDGTPTQAGTYPFIVRVTDSTNPTHLTRDFGYAITISADPAPQPTKPDYERVQTHADTEAAATRDGGNGQTINGVFAPKLNDLGQQGAVFVFGYLPESVAVAPNTLWYFDSAKNWHLFADCRAAPAFFTGELDVIHLIPIVTEATDLSALKGGELYIGYGLGGYAQPSGVACNDMFARQNWKKVYTVQ